MENVVAGPAKNLGAWLFIGFGAAIAFASLPATSAPTVFLADAIFWPIDGSQVFTPESQLLVAILGGVMLGFGATLLVIISKVYPREPQLVRTAIMTGVWIWFTIDSVASLAAGAPLNALLNIGFLLAFVLPWRNIPDQAQLAGPRS